MGGKGWGGAGGGGGDHAPRRIKICGFIRVHTAVRGGGRGGGGGIRAAISESFPAPCPAPHPHQFPVVVVVAPLPIPCGWLHCPPRLQPCCSEDSNPFKVNNKRVSGECLLRAPRATGVRQNRVLERHYMVRHPVNHHLFTGRAEPSRAPLNQMYRADGFKAIPESFYNFTKMRTQF